MVRKFPNNVELGKAAEVIHSKEHIILAAFSYTVSRFVEITARREGAKRLSLNVLAELVDHGGSLNPTQLAKMLWSSRHTITIVVDNLEKDGFVVRKRIDKDRRAVRVKITSAGLNFIVQTIQTIDNYWKDIVGVLNKDEREELVKLLQKMIAKFPKDIILFP